MNYSPDILLGEFFCTCHHERQRRISPGVTVILSDSEESHQVNLLP